VNHSGYQVVDQLGERTVGDDEEADEKKKKKEHLYLPLGEDVVSMTLASVNCVHLGMSVSLN
jgi:hypothetical protein